MLQDKYLKRWEKRGLFTHRSHITDRKCPIAYISTGGIAGAGDPYPVIRSGRSGGGNWNKIGTGFTRVDQNTRERFQECCSFQHLDFYRGTGIAGIRPACGKVRSQGKGFPIGWRDNGESGNNHE